MPLVVNAARLFIGCVLLLSAFMKGLDIAAFARHVEVIFYGIGFPALNLTGMLAAICAWITAAVEFAVGGMLLAGLWVRVAAIGALALSSLFAAVTAWGTLSERIQTCGCFGAVLETPPWIGLIESVLLLAASFAVVSNENTTKPRGLIREAMIMLFGLVWMLYFYLNPAPNATFHRGMKFDVEAVNPPDKQVFWHFDPDCAKCQGQLDWLNDFARANDVPALVGVTTASAGGITEFQIDFAPQFPILQISESISKRIGLPPGVLLRTNDGTLARIIRSDEIFTHPQRATEMLIK